jgi:hypothetical protein
MGKRELLIVAAFLAMGVVAYEVAAPPAAGGEPRLSFSALVDRFHRGNARGRARASTTTTGTLALSSAITEVRVAGVNHVTIRGEARDDIEYALTVESVGPDEPAARAASSRTTLSQDWLGSVLALRAVAPRGERHAAALRLSVPARLVARVEGLQGAATLDAAGVAGVHLDGVIGDVRLHQVAGAVGGTHRNGDLVVTDAGAVDLNLVASQASFTDIRGAVSLNARGGRSTISSAAGPIDLEATNEEITVTDAGGRVRITGTGGSARIDRPAADLYVDMRRTTVGVSIDADVAATILTTDAPLHLQLVDAPAIILDALSDDGGAISTDDPSHPPVTDQQQTRLRQTIRSGTATVALRNRRAPIEISGVK